MPGHNRKNIANSSTNPSSHQCVFSAKIDDYSWSTVTPAEQRKCRQRFQAYKPEGCSKISRREIEKMLRQNGIEINDEEVLNMLWEADPKGQGFIDFQSFCKMIEKSKQKKYEETNSFIGLTFDSVLEQQRIKTNDPFCSEVTWDFLKFYLRQNFELDVGVHALMGNNKVEKPLTRHQFMDIFS